MSGLNQELRPDVLVVDDEDDIRQIVRMTLELEGLTVTDQGNPRAALAGLPRLAPRAIVLDVMMPDLDGFAFLTAMGRDPILAAIPVVVLTCRSRERDYVQGLQHGAIDYLSKPFEPDVLVAVVGRVLSMSTDERREHRSGALRRALVLQQVEDAFG